MGLLRRKTATDATGTDDEAPAPEERSAIHAGVPGRCPECDGFGYIDNIDMRYRFQTQHCLDCGHRWEFSFDAEGDVIDLTNSADASSSESVSR